MIILYGKILHVGALPHSGERSIARCSQRPPVADLASH
jgi:hypothetical protein